MLTHEHQAELTLSSISYPTLIQKIIARKKNRLLRKALKTGREQAINECEPFITELQNTIKTLHKSKINYIISHAEKMVEEHLLKNPHAIVAMALKLLKNIAEHTDVEMTASKIDAQIIRESLNEISMACASARKVTILEDDTFKRGSLVIKANKSIIDAHLKTQLNKAKEVLLMHTSS